MSRFEIFFLDCLAEGAERRDREAGERQREDADDLAADSAGNQEASSSPG
jgi:hypothetical protein